MEKKTPRWNHSKNEPRCRRKGEIRMPDNLDRRTRALEQRRRVDTEREAEIRQLLQAQATLALCNRIYYGHPEPGDIERLIEAKGGFDSDTTIREADVRFWSRQIGREFQAYEI